MKSNHAEDMRRKWQSWLDRIQNDMMDLCWRRGMYHRLIEIIRANPRIDEGNYLYDWIFGNYARVASVSIRRLLDHHRGTVSLHNLTDVILKHPQIINRQHYIAGYDQSNHDVANAEFDELVGKGRDTVDPSILEKALNRADTSCKIVKEFVDKSVAHRDVKPPDVLPTYTEIDDAIDAVGELFRFLYRLLLRSDFSLTVLDAYAWEWVLEQPWILPENPAGN